MATNAPEMEKIYGYVDTALQHAQKSAEWAALCQDIYNRLNGMKGQVETDVQAAIADIDRYAGLATESVRLALDSYKKIVDEKTAGSLDDVAQATASSIDAISALQNAGYKGTALLPLGGGISVRAAVADADKLLVTIGAGITVEKSAEESISYLNDRITEMDASEKRLSESIAKLQEQMQAVDARMQQIYAAVQAQQPMPHA